MKEQLALEKQEDPYAVYIVVNETLNMTGGKIGAQIGHCIESLCFHYFDLTKEAIQLQKEAVNARATGKEIPYRYTVVARKISLMNEWRNSGRRKIVLKADSKEWAKLKNEYVEGIDRWITIDAGLTICPAGSETTMSIFPMRKSQRSKTLKHLQVLE